MFKKNDNRSLNNSIDLLRIVIMSVLFGAVIILFLIKLVDFQIVNHDDYTKEVVLNTYKTRNVEMSRGHIYDRNGVELVSNKKIYSIAVQYSTIDKNNYNAVLVEFIDFCEKYGLALSENLPVAKNAPYVFDISYIFDKHKEKKLSEFVKLNLLEDEPFFDEDESFYKYLCEKYKTASLGLSPEKERLLVGIRYDMETGSFGYFDDFVLLENVDEKTRTLVSENLHKMHGITIVSEDERYYNYDTFACHILGRCGKLDASDVDEYVNNKGYSYDEIIGREGAERAFEEFLHGYAGIEKLEIDKDNNVVSKETVREGKNGYSVNLTIDAGLQRVAEEALLEQIQSARKAGLSDLVAYNGEDCNAGSVVVMNVNTGEVLASASYPVYNLNTFSEDISALNSDKARPLVNRAAQGIYPPGSTFKIATAIAALSEGVVTPYTLVNDTGRYTAYEDYQPACWSLTSRGYGHGWVDLKKAIEESCNVYFYKVADDMGIDALTKYASLLGLGKKTGIEIPESAGILAGPEYRDSKGLLWNPGDTLQAAIGQSDNAFTPLQLCSYMSTIVNGGKRYKATLLDSAVDFYTGEVVFKNTPQVLSEVYIPADTAQIIKSAMKSVVDEGTASSVFLKSDYEVGGKTGTAQVSSGSDTVLFIGFAPYDNPEIAVSVVVEHGEQSSRATRVAKAVFDYYFEQKENSDGEQNE